MITIDEAIDRLYNMKNKVDVALMNSKHEKGHWLYDDVQGTADTLRMAIKALEKQIPKKVVYYRYDRYYLCPTCSHYICDKETAFSLDDTDFSYCDGCGQKLKWRDEK